MIVAVVTAIAVLGTDLRAPVELLDGIRITEGFVEFEGEVAIDAHHPDTPDVYLEMFVTGRDSREHESLVVSDITGSALHAALLAAGFEPGSPWSPEGPASGDRVRVKLTVDGPESETRAWADASAWVIDDQRERSLADATGWDGFVFAGSGFDARGYRADRSKALVSLTVFGDEVVSAAWGVSHDASVHTPEWIADNTKVPDRGTPVWVRILPDEVDGSEGDHSGSDPSEEPDRVDVDDG